MLKKTKCNCFLIYYFLFLIVFAPPLPQYACRKTLADNRPRIRGRFARNDETGEIPKAACSTGIEDEDYLWVNKTHPFLDFNSNTFSLFFFFLCYNLSWYCQSVYAAWGFAWREWNSEYGTVCERFWWSHRRVSVLWLLKNIDSWKNL